MSTPFDQPSALKGSSDPEGGDGAYSYDGKPDRWKRYRLPDPDTGKAAGFTRATTFAKSMADTYALNQWALRMGGKGLAERPDLLMAVASTPLSNAQKLNSIMEEAKNQAGAKVGANLGTALHAFSEEIDKGNTPIIPPPYRPHMAAYTALMEKYNLEIVEIEKVVLCRTYGIAGTLDRIVRFTKDTVVETPDGGTYTFKKGTLAILDLKTGKDLSYGWMEICIQLAIYANAELLWDKEALEYRLMPPEMDRNVALVVHLPATAPGDTVAATMYAIDIAGGWEDAELCMKVRDARKRKGRATALAVVEEAGVVESVTFDPNEFDPTSAVSEVPRIKVVAEREDTIVRLPTLVERAQSARTEADLQAVWFDAVKTRQDTRDLAAAITARKAIILADSAAG